MNDIFEFSKKNALIIVLYKTRLVESITFNSFSDILKGTDCKMDLIVYDNSPELNVGLQEFENWRIKYIGDPLNSGISLAYNIGARYAKDILKKSRLLIADQDTFFPINSISAYVDAVEMYPLQAIYAPIIKSKEIISPCRFLFNRGFTLNRVKDGLMSFKGRSLINSGCLIDLDAFFLVGGYNEKIQLDFSDFYFFEKVKAKFSEFVVVNLILSQNYSDDSDNNLKSRLFRFKFYCEGAKEFSLYKKSGVLLIVVTFIRMLKLSKMFKTKQFAVMWVKKMLL
ncbi:Glycosyltransferase, GT2 family [Reichenbachiella agariperforans]|uniref:Glycosyltransferase, GT2 family n=1 Tax=Reichenbachiella agariperforans TaxID=156994 RepID=A0A1M6NUM8_REIAG|nr:hypothetical protein [Reichenbachiella agariperforans]SHJ99332.1 Glycosyltransferase, GT2 family [Reichenbachiella agariperforans]